MMFGNKDKEWAKGALIYSREQMPVIMRVPEKVQFIEFQGAMASVDEDTNRLEYTPRGPIWIQAGNIGAYYDHTILLFGNKIRVMETAEEIREKLTEGMA